MISISYCQKSISANRSRGLEYVNCTCVKLSATNQIRVLIHSSILICEKACVSAIIRAEPCSRAPISASLGQRSASDLGKTLIDGSKVRQDCLQLFVSREEPTGIAAGVYSPVCSRARADILKLAGKAVAIGLAVSSTGRPNI